MATLTFIGNEGSPDCVEWNGIKFPVGEAVSLDLSVFVNRHMLEKAKGNPFFQVDATEDELTGWTAEVVPIPTPEPEPVQQSEPEPVETPQEAATDADYITPDQMATMDKTALKSALEALGIEVDGRWSAETMREKLMEAYG